VHTSTSLVALSRHLGAATVAQRGPAYPLAGGLSLRLLVVDKQAGATSGCAHFMLNILSNLL
jgi:hypothetical protein